MARDLKLKQRLENFGVEVVEIDGWQTRGSSFFHPVGSVNHHTAGAATGVAPSLNICIRGRSDVPGPLCNVLLGRDNRAYLIAAGRANHAGRGSWNGVSGNSNFYGLEVEHRGTSAELLSPERYATMVAIHAAFAHGKFNPLDMTCQHWEWTSRKIDFYRPQCPEDQFRRDVNHVTHGSIGFNVDDLLPRQELERGDTGDDVKRWQRIVKVTVDGDFGPITESATVHYWRKTTLDTEATGTVIRTALKLGTYINAMEGKPTNWADYPMIPLRVGSTGEHVRRWQKLMKVLANGIYDTPTQLATLKFVRYLGLNKKVDKDVIARTRAILVYVNAVENG